MYIYHALINALSAHMICINLNMILYTHVKHSPTKTIYIKYYKKKKIKKKCPLDNPAAKCQKKVGGTAEIKATSSPSQQLSIIQSQKQTKLL